VQQQEYAILDASIALQIYRKVEHKEAYDISLKELPDAQDGTPVLCRVGNRVQFLGVLRVPAGNPAQVKLQLSELPAKPSGALLTSC
jgi:hypothetical protein